jgi:outer membrane protein TolC
MSRLAQHARLLLAVSVALALPQATARAERLDLAACVSRALARNPQLQDAADATDSAALAMRVAKAEYDLKIVPTINGGFQGGNTTNQTYQLLFSRKLLSTGAQAELSATSQVFATVPQVSVPYFSETRVTLSQPVLRGWGRIETHEKIDDAGRRIESSENALAIAREDVTLQVVQAYYDVVRAAQLYDLADASLRRVNELRDMASAKLELGTASKMDVYRTELHLTRVKNSLVDQRSRNDAALDTLKLLLGIDPRIHVEIDSSLQGPVVNDLQGSNLEEQALERRIELAEAREQVADSERKLTLARRRLLPDMALVGTYARRGVGDSIGRSLELDETEWNIGIRSSIDLDRTVEEVGIADAEITLRGRERRYNASRDEVLRQVRLSAREFERQKADVALARDAAEQARQQAELARLRYERGVTDNFDLVQAEEQLAESQAAQVVSMLDQTVAAAIVRRAIGTLSEAFTAPTPPASDAAGDPTARTRTAPQPDPGRVKQARPRVGTPQPGLQAAASPPN